MKPTPELVQRAREIQQMTTNFCKRHLTDEYALFCEKIINQILRSPSQSVLMNGRAVSIAAGVIQVISVNNFLSKSRLHPLTADKIAELFGISAGSVAAKAALIRKAANVKKDYDPDYGSAEALENSYWLKMRIELVPLFENLRKLSNLQK